MSQSKIWIIIVYTRFKFVFRSTLVSLPPIDSTPEAPHLDYVEAPNRHLLPEEFVDRSWLILPEDNSNLQVSLINDYNLVISYKSI